MNYGYSTSAILPLLDILHFSYNCPTLVLNIRGLRMVAHTISFENKNLLTKSVRLNIYSYRPTKIVPKEAKASSLHISK